MDEVIVLRGASLAKHFRPSKGVERVRFAGEADPVAVTQQMPRMFVVSSSCTESPGGVMAKPPGVVQLLRRGSAASNASVASAVQWCAARARRLEALALVRASANVTKVYQRVRPARGEGSEDENVGHGAGHGKVNK